MLNVRLAGGHLYGKQPHLAVAGGVFVGAFCAVLFPTRCLGCDLGLNWISFWGIFYLFYFIFISKFVMFSISITLTTTSIQRIDTRKHMPGGRLSRNQFNKDILYIYTALGVRAKFWVFPLFWKSIANASCVCNQTSESVKTTKIIFRKFPALWLLRTWFFNILPFLLQLGVIFLTEAYLWIIPVTRVLVVTALIWLYEPGFNFPI